MGNDVDKVVGGVGDDIVEGEGVEFGDGDDVWGVGCYDGGGVEREGFEVVCCCGFGVGDFLKGLGGLLVLCFFYIGVFLLSERGGRYVRVVGCIWVWVWRYFWYKFFLCGGVYNFC